MYLGVLERGEEEDFKVMEIVHEKFNIVEKKTVEGYLKAGKKREFKELLIEKNILKSSLFVMRFFDHSAKKQFTYNEGIAFCTHDDLLETNLIQTIWIIDIRVAMSRIKFIDLFEQISEADDINHMTIRKRMVDKFKVEEVKKWEPLETVSDSEEDTQILGEEEMENLKGKKLKINL
jgi:hypothetical protein